MDGLDREDMATIGRIAGSLMIRRDMICKHAALWPSAVILNASEFPPLDGEDEGATMLGLPVIWGDRTALVYDA